MACGSGRGQFHDTGVTASCVPSLTWVWMSKGELTGISRLTTDELDRSGPDITVHTRFDNRICQVARVVESFPPLEDVRTDLRHRCKGQPARLTTATQIE